MLFRNNEGKLIEIKKENYYNDKDYYKQICLIYNIQFPKDYIESDKILSLVNIHPNIKYSSKQHATCKS